MTTPLPTETKQNELKNIIKTYSPSELAELIVNQPSYTERFNLFSLLPSRKAVQVFEFLPLSFQTEVLYVLPPQEISRILDDLSPDDRTTLLEALPTEVTNQLIKFLSPEEKTITLKLLGYPEGSVGRLMTPDYIAVKIDWTIRQVLSYIRIHALASETINIIYVVDDQGILIDDMRIRDILLAPLKTKVQDLLDQNFIALSVYDDEEKAVDVFRKHNRVALPVVDHTGLLLGIVTIDDILRVADEEDTEDIQKIGGTEALDEPYMDTPFLKLMQKRAGWLVLLFLGEMLTASAMGYFEYEISQVIVLASFIPLIISSGGNSGSQASTLIIRAMALEEIKMHDWWRIMRRELFAGFFLGCILGCIGFIRVASWSQFSDIYGPHWMLIALTIFFSLIGVVLWGTITGSMLPFILRKCKLDPAVSSVPFVATIVDVTGLIIYFNIAFLLLKGVML